MIYAIESTSIDTYGQSTRMDSTEEIFLGSFESQEEAFQAFLVRGDERLESEIKSGSKLKDVVIGSNYYAFDYWPTGWYNWIREIHWVFTHNG